MIATTGLWYSLLLPQIPDELAEVICRSISKEVITAKSHSGIVELEAISAMFPPNAGANRVFRRSLRFRKFRSIIAFPGMAMMQPLFHLILRDKPPILFLYSYDTLTTGSLAITILITGSITFFVPQIALPLTICTLIYFCMWISCSYRSTYFSSKILFYCMKQLYSIVSKLKGFGNQNIGSLMALINFSLSLGFNLTRHTLHLPLINLNISELIIFLLLIAMVAKEEIKVVISTRKIDSLDSTKPYFKQSRDLDEFLIWAWYGFGTVIPSEQDARSILRLLTPSGEPQGGSLDDSRLAKSSLNSASDMIISLILLQQYKFPFPIKSGGWFYQRKSKASPLQADNTL